MKNIIKYRIIAISIALLFVGCGQHDEIQQDGTSEIKLAPVVSSITRATATTFELTDEIGLYVVKMNMENCSLLSERFIENIRFTNTAKGFRSYIPVYYPGDGKNVSCYAYYPYSEVALKAGESTLDFEVKDEQFKGRNYTDSDLMLAKNENVENGAPLVALNFTHVLSQIEIVLKPGVGYTDELLVKMLPYVKIKGVKTSCTADMNHLTVIGTTEVKDIYPTNKLTASAGLVKGMMAVIIPQTVAADADFLEIEINGITYTYKPSADMVFESGKKYLFTVLINKRDIEVAVSIESWKDGLAHQGDCLPAEPDATDIEGNVYKTVKIGEQVWFAENLRTTKLNDGTDIPLAVANDFTFDMRAVYSKDADETTIRKYGLLYNWKAVETGKLCPAGWHIASDDDYKALIATVGATSNGKMLKSTSMWAYLGSEKPTYQGNNTSGFNAYPAGFGEDRKAGVNSAITREARFWVSTLVSNKACNYYLTYSATTKLTLDNTVGKLSTLSVRCVKD